MIRCLHFLRLAGLAMFVLVALFAAQVFAADGILDVDPNMVEVDLAGYRTPISAERVKISVQGPQDPKTADLVAHGPGPTYYWSLFSFHNTSDQPLEFTLALNPQRFAGSGIINLRPAGQVALGAVLTKDSKAVAPESVGPIKLVRVHVAPRETSNIAVESAGPALGAVLWRADALQGALAWQAFYRGVIFGVALLVTLGLLATCVFRPNAPGIAGFLFSLAATAFIAFDSGLFPAVLFTSWMRCLIENAMMASLAMAIPLFLRAKINTSYLSLALLSVPFLAAANVGYGWVETEPATAIARLGFAAVVAAGFAATYYYRGINKDIIDPNMVFWLLIFGWTVLAAIAAMDAARAEALSPVFLALLAVVIIGLALVLLRDTFAQGVQSKSFMTDQSRRSLALASGGHIFWDWQPATGVLSVGNELAEDLGYSSTGWSSQARSLFKEIIHPLDATAYEKFAERNDLAAGDIIEMDLRLKDFDGKYHWFALQATAVTGQNEQVDRCIGTLTDISNLKTTEERLSSDALQDVVTGLPNRALLQDRLERSLTKIGGLPQRVVIVDIDRFKLINESLGQEQGDRLLRITGDRLVELLEEDETVARLPGSQFGMACSETIERGNFEPFVKKIAETVSEPIRLSEQDVVLTASIGVSSSSKEGAKGAMLMDHANVAMLQARAEGGARAITYHADMKDERAKLLTLESDLRRALAHGEIEIHFQPICYLATLDIAGFEALARWRHPKLGVLPPAEFIDIAEATGLIMEIGQFVISGAARQLGIWQRILTQGRPFFVSVNVSVNQLLAPDFVRSVRSIVDREGIEQGSLKLEITESLIMRQPERAAKVLQQLQALGIGLACDDFGTGFSSLSSLRDLPFDTLKLDKSFIAPENFDQRNGMIISSICSLARSLAMVVVAEGIETQKQIDKLAEFGCSLGQGYLLAEPETAQAASERLAVLPVTLEAPSLPDHGLPPSTSLYDPPPSTRRFEFATSVFEDDSDPQELPSLFALPAPGSSSKPKKRAKKKASTKAKK